MYLSQLQIENFTDDQLTKLLFHVGADDQKKADCIFVPGSSKAVDYKVPKAVSLYKAGRADTLLFSGGVAWDESMKPEAILMQERAVQYGVPQEAILTETQSLHTKENVLASLLILDRAFDLHHIKRILIVTSSIHTRRVLLTMKTYMPEWISYSLAPIDDRTTKETNWFKSPYSRKRVLTEATKLVEYARIGAILDQDVGEL